MWKINLHCMCPLKGEFAFVYMKFVALSTGSENFDHGEMFNVLFQSTTKEIRKSNAKS